MSVHQILVPEEQEVNCVVVCAEYERLNRMDPEKRSIEELDQLLVHADQCPMHGWRRNMQKVAN